MKMINLSQIKGLLRHVLSALGGILIGLGILPHLDADTLKTVIELTDGVLGNVEMLIGGIISLIAVLKSIMDKSPTPPTE